MDKKYENGMSLEQLVGEMLKDAKVVKIPIQPKQDAEQEAQKSDKPLAAHPAGKADFAGGTVHHGSARRRGHARRRAGECRRGGGAGAGHCRSGAGL